MRNGRRAQHDTVTAALLAGAAIAAVGWVGGVRAQTVFDLPTRTPGVAAPVFRAEHPSQPPAPPRAAPGDDALGSNGFYIEANSLERDTAHDTWTAVGQVEARYQGRTLRANRVLYDAARGVVIADGAAQLINADGTVQSASHLVMDDKMRAGFARGFSAHEAYNVTVAADVAIRRSEMVNELDRAIFTPCEICAANGSPKEPTWSIQASRIIEDRTHRIIYYRNAVVRVKGIPVFYTPVLSTPDPTAPRASGFLIPRITIGGTRGFSVEQPYLWVVSPSQELVVSPQISTKVNPVINLQWLKRFYSGSLDLRAGYTYEKNFNSSGDKFGDATSRSYVLGRGAFDLNKDWSWGFGVGWTSDPLFFQKYNTPDVQANRGLFQDDSQRLSSQLYVNRQTDTSYLSISALSFQGLRQLGTSDGVGITEDNRIFPIVAPLIEWRYDPNFSLLGGRLRLVGTAVAITRNRNPLDPSIDGPDSRRLTMDADWLRTFTLSNGMRIEPFADVRANLYNVDHLSATDTANKTLPLEMGSVGVNFSWPFIRQSGNTSIVLEPIVQLSLSPDVKRDPDIPNEDSQIFQLDETSLFSIDKFSGYDLYDGGAQVNVGGRATVDWGGGLNAHFVFGRTMRADTTNVFASSTGLDRPFSDWVIYADTTPVAGLSLFGRALLTDSFNPVRQELGVNFAYARAQGYLRYVYDDTISATDVSGATTSPTTPGGPVINTPTTPIPEHDIEAAGEFFVTNHWGFSLVGIRDLQANEWRQRDVGLVYKDDCIKVEVFYQHQDVIQGQLGHSDTVFVRLTLATLSDQGYTGPGVR